jgi:hypothetical protein
MRVRHPYALKDEDAPVDGRVHIGGRRDTHPVDDDGVVTVAEGVSRSAVASWAASYGYELDELLVDKDDGDTNGSDASTEDAEALVDNGVCPWCEDEFENVAAHAGQIHPNKWDTYTND